MYAPGEKRKKTIYANWDILYHHKISKRATEISILYKNNQQAGLVRIIFYRNINSTDM